MTTFAINARLIGNERQPVVTIDQFAPDPDALRAAAQAASFGPASYSYPGLRAPVPHEYWHCVRSLLATVLHDVFDYRRSARLIDAGFAIVSTAREALSTEQRLPHVDATAAGRIAFVHHLSDTKDGTAFFRHRATGFETISEERSAAYLAHLREEMSTCGPPPPGYITGSGFLFDRTYLAPPRYNRAVIYRSCLLHSGAISEDADLCPDPAAGRLTITGFLDAS